MTPFAKKLARLRNDLVEQGGRVTELTLRAVEALFDLDAAKAREVVAGDDVIDRVDVEIERASIPLLAMGPTDEHDIRSVLTIVKINPELERIADCAVSIAEVVGEIGSAPEKYPPTFRVMANSVVGMLRDANRALAELDTGLCEQVLSFDDTIERFKKQITLDAQEQVAAGRFSVPSAFRLLTATRALERIADHCTNIAEQVIYLERGLIVRHLPQGWTKPAPPDV